MSLVHNDNRLSEQLTSNAQARALKLELENRRLNTLIDSLKEVHSMKIPLAFWNWKKKKETFVEN